ncbi:MAG: signal peptidase II [SAR324 cluster bacterium]|nr:signal peptidase II [SAR324 cluster bacterium]
MTIQRSILIMALLLVLDEGVKILVRLYIPIGDVTVLLPNMLELTHVENPGVSFGFLAGLPSMIRIPLLSGMSILAIGGMVFYLYRYWIQLDLFTKSALILTIPGAMGNLVDRVIYGTVTDFLHFLWYGIPLIPTFVNNLADCFISLGVVLLIIGTFRGNDQAETSSV